MRVDFRPFPFDRTVGDNRPTLFIKRLGTTVLHSLSDQLQRGSLNGNAGIAIAIHISVLQSRFGLGDFIHVLSHDRFNLGR